jgi:integrase/recombinase XerD
MKLKVKDLAFKTTDNYQYAEVLVNGKTGSRPIPLINSIPYVKDYLDHEHPQSSNPNAPLICGIGKSLGRHITASTLSKIYGAYKKQLFPKLLESPNVRPEDKQKIKELLKKPFNPYIRRHSALTEKSTILKEHILRQHAGWSGKSQMHLKYLHYFGNESSESLLEAYGIIPKGQHIDQLKPKQCPNCNEPNKPDSKFCAKCRMVLTYDAYNETLENQKEKEDKLTSMEKRFSAMQSQVDMLISTLGTMDQSSKNELAKKMFENGLYKQITKEA